MSSESLIKLNVRRSTTSSILISNSQSSECPGCKLNLSTIKSGNVKNIIKKEIFFKFTSGKIKFLK